MRKHNKYFLILIIGLLLSAAVNAQLSSADLPGFNFGNSFQGATGSDGGTINAVLAFKKVQEAADNYYKAEDYKAAFKLYLELAKYNDKFSQYRVGNMYARGRGTEKDMVKAYAWTYLAAEERQKGFVNYHVSLRESMSPEEIESGRQMATEYLDDYGTFAIANQARKLIKKGKRNCTGSRVGGSCDKVGSTGFNCGLTSQGQLGTTCLTLGSIGLPAISGMLPADLRNVEKQLDNMIDNFNPGTVTLGDLELIED